MIKPKCAENCEKRAPGCHAECRDYGEYAAMLKARNDKIKAAREKNKDWTIGKKAIVKRAKQRKPVR